MSAVELDYARHMRRQRRDYRRLLLRTAVAVAILTVLGTLTLGRYSMTQVCRATAMVRVEKGWVIPGTDLRIWASATERPTPLAEALARTGTGGSQPGWLTVQPWRGCAHNIGTLAECQSTRVARFIEGLSRYVGADAVTQWADFILSGHSRGCLETMLQAFEHPESLASSGAEFKEWWEECGRYFDEFRADRMSH